MSNHIEIQRESLFQLVFLIGGVTLWWIIFTIITLAVSLFLAVFTQFILLHILSLNFLLTTELLKSYITQSYSIRDWVVCLLICSLFSGVILWNVLFLGDSLIHIVPTTSKSKRPQQPIQ